MCATTVVFRLSCQAEKPLSVNLSLHEFSLRPSREGFPPPLRPIDNDVMPTSTHPPPLHSTSQYLETPDRPSLHRTCVTESKRCGWGAQGWASLPQWAPAGSSTRTKEGWAVLGSNDRWHETEKRKKETNKRQGLRFLHYPPKIKLCSTKENDTFSKESWSTNI